MPMTFVKPEELDSYVGTVSYTHLTLPTSV